MTLEPGGDRRVPLVERQAAGERLKFVCFWSHEPRGSGVLGPWLLSQWFPAPFEFEGISYPTAEHWMMAEKARIFGDSEAVDRVLAARHPGEAKAIGGQVRGFDEREWTRCRTDVAVQGNVLKFTQSGSSEQVNACWSRRALETGSGRVGSRNGTPGSNRLRRGRV